MSFQRFSALGIAFLVVGCGGETFSAEGKDGGGASGPGGSSDASTGGYAGHAGSGGIAASGGSGGSSGSGGATGSGGAAGSGGEDAGPTKNSGDCDTPEDCAGDPCVEVTPGGYRVCGARVEEITSCTVPTGGIGCCSAADCPAGDKCYQQPIPSCGGAQMIANECASDRCSSDLACGGANAICVPAGTLGRKVRACVPGGCRVDADCKAEPGGFCAPVTEGCCSTIVGLYCIYQAGCRSDADCVAGQQYCGIDGDRAHCISGLRMCPLAPAP